jgi:hypothetical protein
MLAHLKADKVDVAGTKGRFGPTLHFDPKTERCISHMIFADKANAMLFREYRKGFELKEIA